MNFVTVKASVMSAARNIALGGVASCGFVLFTLAVSTASQAQTYTDLHDIDPPAGEPVTYDGGRLAQGRDGNFYATSGNGGTIGDGTVIKLTPSGQLSIIHSFTQTEGSSAHGGLTLGLDGELYGNTVQGGADNFGTLFKVTTAGKLTLLHTFANTGDGAAPWYAPVQGLDGNFYGLTNSNPATVYKVTPVGTFTTIHTLTSMQGYDGGQLTVGSTGLLYGAVDLGGANGEGTAFRVTTAGAMTILHQFDGVHGNHAANGMVQAANGKLYGATLDGGTPNGGVIYSMTSAGAYVDLYELNANTDGSGPFGDLVYASDGNLYGVTNTAGKNGCGTIFKVTTAGVYTVLYNFDQTHGCNPEEQMIQDTNGSLYGITQNGGAFNAGAFYSLNAKLPAFIALQTASGAEGSKVSILGQGFSASSIVEFDGVKATTITRTGTTYISATIPASALTGKVTVTTGSTKLSSLGTFKIVPTVASFTPAKGVVGTEITIKGTGLKQTTKVALDGTAADFTVVSDTEISTSVPAGAKTGKIAITTKGGSTSSTATFTVN